MLFFININCLNKIQELIKINKILGSEIKKVKFRTNKFEELKIKKYLEFLQNL